jgi:hypothetical protein
MPVEKMDPSTIFTDDDGNRWTPGECECNLEIVEAIVDIVIKALPELTKIICAAWFSSFQLIAEAGITAGLSLVPGGQVAIEARLAVQAAKSFVENGMTAESFFGNWAGETCGVDDWNFDLITVFTSLVNAPDSAGTSIGCLKKNKKDCKKLEPKPDPKQTDKPIDKPTEKPEDKPTDKPAQKSTDKPVATTEPATTKSTEGKPATSSASASACKLGKRAGPGVREGKLGEDERREEECNKQKTIHITKTDKAIGWYTKEIPMTCSKKYSQACYHYRRVLSNY